MARILAPRRREGEALDQRLQQILSGVNPCPRIGMALSLRGRWTRVKSQAQRPSSGLFNNFSTWNGDPPIQCAQMTGARCQWLIYRVPVFDRGQWSGLNPALFSDWPGARREIDALIWQQEAQPQSEKGRAVATRTGVGHAVQGDRRTRPSCFEGGDEAMTLRGRRDSIFAAPSSWRMRCRGISKSCDVS